MTPAWHRPPEPMRYQRPDGSWAVEMLGNVFRPGTVPKNGTPLMIAYSYGPDPVNKQAAVGVSGKTPMWTCPVCAIPPEVWDLLQLYHQCRLFGLPPVQGGVLDQPVMVQRSWPLFESEMLRVKAAEDVQRAQHAALASGAMLLGAIFGKGK